MACLDKLLIQGIRSFDPQSPQVIDFLSPLTAIVGTNGSGKTTIIECLKYMTTGDMPPGSKGGGFVHDPKELREKTVNARIKLAFRSCTGHQLIALRSLSSTQTESKISQKAVEGIIQIREEGSTEAKSLSGRCADIDRQMIEILGVSKAVLSNVVFCHQEESNWPLAESADVKKRFEAIFAATKYMKALESIKAIRKEQNIEIKSLEKSVKSAKDIKDKAQEIKEKLGSVQEDIRDTQIRITEIAEELQPVEDQLKTIATMSDQIQDSIRQRDVLAERQQDLIQQAQRKKQNLEPEYQESDAELETMLDNYNQTLQEQQRIEKKMEKGLREVKSRQAILSEELAENRGQLGGLQNAYENYKRKCKLRDSLVEELANVHQIHVPSGDSSRAAKAFHQAITTKIQTFEEDLGKVKSKTKRKTDQLSREHDSTHADLAQCNAFKTEKENSLKEALGALHDVRDKLARLPASSVTADGHMAEAEKLEAQLNQHKSSLNVTQISRQLNQLEKEKKDLLIERRALEQQHSETASNLQKLTALDVKNEQLQKKIQKRDDMLLEHQAQLQELFETDVTADTALNTFQEAYKSHSLKVKEVKKVLQNLQHESALKGASIKRLEQDMADLKQSLAEKQEEISDECGVLSVDDAIEQSKQQVTELSRARTYSKETKIVLNELLRQSRTEDCCALCKRGFGSKQEFNDMVANVRKFLDNVTKADPSVTENLQNAEASLRKREHLKLVEADIDEIEGTKIPDLEDKIAAATLEAEELATQIEEQETTVNVQEEKLEQLHEVQGICSTLTSLSKECYTAQRSLDAERRQIPVADTSVTLDDLNLKLKTMAADIQNKEELKDRTKATLDDFHQRTNLLQTQLNEHRAKINEINKQVHEHKTLSAKEKQLQETVAKLQKDIALQQDKIAPLERKLHELRTKQAEVRRQSEQEMTRLNDSISKLRQDLNRFDVTVADIRSFEDNNKQRELESLTTQIAESEATHKELQLKETELTRKLRETKKVLSNKEAYKRNIEDNLEYRSILQAIQDNKRRSAELKQQLDDLGANDAFASKPELESTKDRLTKQHAKQLGRKEELQSQKQMLQNDLECRLYRDADLKHREEFIKLKTTEMASDDLLKYSRALDKAIVRFHEMKLKEINKIIEQLWRAAYKGGDIEKIEIKTSSAGTTSTNRKSYHYRVVMIKRNGTAMDMRGRCSAGQKVMAALIIRMALAEAFCINCGILALDEPTTNLDEANIAGLAESLSTMIAERRQQTNFQLIVITHDERFLELMGKRDLFDQYYRVRKNPE